MTAKEFLTGIQHDRRRAAAVKERISRLESVAQSVTARYGNGGGGGAHSDGGAIERAVIRIVEERERLGVVLERMHTARAEAVRLIERLPAEQLKDVLERRYLDGKSWARIAREMRYSKQHIYRLHERALKEFAQVFEDASK